MSLRTRKCLYTLHFLLHYDFLYYFQLWFRFVRKQLNEIKLNDLLVLRLINQLTLSFNKVYIYFEKHLNNNCLFI